MRLIVVGASGLIGSALMRTAHARGEKTIGTALKRSSGELLPFDLRSNTLSAVVPDLGPKDVVYLLAGYIAPKWIFENPEAATALNLDASRRLSDEVLERGARLIFMSTDLVFDGETGGYTESAVPNPLNLYGRLKVAIERHVLGARQGIVARTGWNVGWEQGQHCAVAQCYETLLRPGARMAEDNLINITDVNDTAAGLLALGREQQPERNIYHLVSAPEMARSDLAELIRQTSSLGPGMSFERVLFDAIPYDEPRPRRAFLRSETAPLIGVDFVDPQATVRRKVAVLDQWRLRSVA